MKLIYLPHQPHHKLIAGGAERSSGDVFDVPDDEAAEILADPRNEVQEAPAPRESASASGDEKTDDKTPPQSQRHSARKNGGQ